MYAKLQEAWHGIKQGLSDINAEGALSKAMEIGKEQVNSNSVTTFMETMVRNNGGDKMLTKYNHILQPLKNMPTQNVVPYVLKIVQDIGIMNILSSILGKK